MRRTSRTFGLFCPRTRLNPCIPSSEGPRDKVHLRDSRNFAPGPCVSVFHSSSRAADEIGNMSLQFVDESLLREPFCSVTDLTRIPRHRACRHHRAGDVATARVVKEHASLVLDNGV